jgi:hypothetical protein
VAHRRLPPFIGEEIIGARREKLRARSTLQDDYSDPES